MHWRQINGEMFQLDVLRRSTGNFPALIGAATDIDVIIMRRSMQSLKESSVPELSELNHTLAAIAEQAREQAAAENFPVALRVLPAGPRAGLAAVYDYARFVDDLGDAAAGDRLTLLDAVAADVKNLPGGTARLPAVRALGPVLAGTRTGLDPLCTPLLKLVAANRFDQGRVRMADFQALLGYCELSAAPVGQLVLALADADDEANLKSSDAVCAALQVLEHCQDVGEDARAGRVYLPTDDLLRYGVIPTDAAEDLSLLLRSRTDPRLRSVVGLQVDRAEELLAAGQPLVNRLHGWARVAVSGYLAGGFATVRALRRANFEVLSAPVTPSRASTLRYAVLFLGRTLGRSERGRG
jgi:squalene synthase HpnC